MRTGPRQHKTLYSAFAPLLFGAAFGIWYIYGEYVLGRRKVFYEIPSLKKPDKDNIISVLNYNVGNIDKEGYPYHNNLYKKDVLKRIAQNIKKLSPDIITLQEMLAPYQCNVVPKDKILPSHICYNHPKVHPVLQLLGKDYQVVCDSRTQFVCTAVKRSIGAIKECSNKRFCLSDRVSPIILGCDTGFTTLISTIILKNQPPFDIVNIHLPSRSATCRAKVLNAIFNPQAGYIQSERVLLMGDFNMDIWRHSPKREDTRTWHTIFARGWAGRPFRYHSGIVEASPPYKTSHLLRMPHTTDFIASNFAQGICVVMGKSKGTFRMDGGEGTDHLALYGFLTLN